jgi:hypothetical protein
MAALRFMVGPLAHLLKYRLYICEIVDRGEAHKGEHAPILDRELFDAVQARHALCRYLAFMIKQRSQDGSGQRLAGPRWE